MNRWTLDPSERPVASRVGGKAAGLFLLQELGLPVPAFDVLTAEAYSDLCVNDTVPEQVPNLEHVLEMLWAKLGAPLAVRSSAVEEDGALHSYAGQMDSVLNVRSRAALTSAVLTCWRSLRSARAQAYRKGAAPGGMAVVVQKMVEPDASGVLFTVNPVERREDQILVSAVWGLGEGLVSGALDADTFVLNRSGKVLSRNIVQKTERLKGQEQGGTRREAVEEGKVTQPTLSDPVLLKLSQLALQAEKKAGHALDMEFAVSGENLFFLQARPVTGVVFGKREVWDNSNIIESYPGVTLPLTFSFIRRAYQAVYHQFCQVLGLSEQEIRPHSAMLSNMLGLITGRVYYNLLNWYRLVALLPGFQFNKKFMEGMMGVQQGVDLDIPQRSRFHEFVRLSRTGIRAVWLHWRLPGLVTSFHKDFDRSYDAFSSQNVARMSPHQAMAYYRDLEEKILWRWKAPIINDFAAMIFYGLLKRLTQKWDVDPEGGLQNALLARQGAIESTEVANALLRLACQIEAHPALREVFTASVPTEALKTLREYPDVQSAFDRFLERYGDRCVGELKLETVSPRENPVDCVPILQGYLRQGVGRVSLAATPDMDPQAELRLRLGGKRFLGVIPKLFLYRWVLRHTKNAVRNRENQRLARTRAYGLVRGLFRSIGRSFQSSGVLDKAEDIFFLDMDEIFAFIEGRSLTIDLRALVGARRKEYDGFLGQPSPPDHFETRGPVYLDLAFEQPSPTQGGTLQGLGACPGVVTGHALVMLEPDPSRVFEGCILVARQTDPGWVSVFPSIKGLVVERGSMLSHSAIVAREMGIPAVVGVPHAASRIETGDTIRLDGRTGRVEIIGGPS